MRLLSLPPRWFGGVLLALLASGLSSPSPGAAAAQPSALGRFIVKLRPASAALSQQPAPARIAALAARQELALRSGRHIVSGMHLLQVQLPARAAAAAQVLARLRADPEVEYAEPDQRRFAHAAPDDPLFGGQWYLQNSEPAAIDAVSAWDVSTGSPGLVIADLDSGVRFDHPDLRAASANRLLPGYDMIAQAASANDGNGRDPDASDPGDWVTAADTNTPQFAGCAISNSSWHGTRTAGILGAITNNSTGVAGVTWSGWILPVRVLGKCGGYDSDILAGMAWAAGMHVDGVPDNPYPAQIINMSLGSAGSCPADYQQLVNELTAAGVLLVVSAGNEGGPVDAPANCAGVAGVAGLRQAGTKVGFSSVGPEIALSAPAGNCVNTGAGEPCLFSIETTTNSGTTTPATNTYTDQIHFNVGTSFSAPIVAGIAGLMLAVNGNLRAPQLIARLRQGAQRFPVSSDPSVPACHIPSSAGDLQTAECNCTTQTCGAGMASARGALSQALRPIAAISVPATYSPGARLTLDGSGSAAACNARLTAYQWTVMQPASHPPAIQNAGTAQAGVTAPLISGTSFTLVLTVTDDSGRTDSAEVVIGAQAPQSTAPAQAGDHACLTTVSYSMPPSGTATGSAAAAAGGGGGGGVLDPFTLLACVLAARLAYRSRWAASSHER
jgi:serine protease